MKLQKKVQQGFTLIELMIVIAIVGILAAIALPAYQDYIVRSKLSEPLAALAEAKTTAAEYVAANAQFPDPSTAFGINTGSNRGTRVLKNLSINPATGLANGSTVYIVANVYASTWGGASGSVGQFQLSGSTNADGSMSWDCLPGDGATTTSSIKLKYLPANCRG